MNAPKKPKPDLRTFVAMQASELSEAFAKSLGAVRIPPGDYAPELTAPEGQSTSGGTLAQQHLRLVPMKSGYPTLLVGGCHTKMFTAELRTFEHVDAVHRERFGKPVDIDLGRFVAFLDMAHNFFEVHGLKTTRIGPPAELAVKVAGPPAGAKKEGGSFTGFVVGFIVMGLIAAGVIWTLLARR